MSKTIFISQPMGGLSDEQVLQERTSAISKAKALLGEDVAPLETFFDDFGPAAKPLDYLARSIEFLAKADVAIFAPGWKNARGCRIEHQRRGLWNPRDGGVKPVESIISAILAGAVTLIGVLIANSRSQAVTDTKLEELTREVREHNNFARRVPILEEQMKVANHRIADLEADEHERERN